MLQILTVKDFTVFSKSEFTFGALNVIHGENSSGKTHLLKLAYSAISGLVSAPNEAAGERPTKAAMEGRIGAKLVGVFRPDRSKLGRLARRVQGQTRAEIVAHFGPEGRLEYSFSTRSDRAVKVHQVPMGWLTHSPAFLPTRELLSVYPGFVSLYQTQSIPFDEIWRDTCVLLGAPVARGPKKKEIGALLDPMQDALGCRAVLEDGRFFVHMTNPNAKVEADLVAEGYRKLAMVARLIANGSLDDKGYLFWDEPEANLNPRLIKRLAPLLLDLAQGGVQVFIATHSLYLMRELEVVRSDRYQTLNTRFFGLRTGSDGVEVSQGGALTQSGDIAALSEDLLQAERMLDQAMGISL